MRIQSIDRAVAILNLFRDGRGSLSLAEIASAMGLAKTTIHTIVQTLVYHGFLHQDIYNKKYSLGFSLFELGTVQAANLEINRIASRPLHDLANQTGSYCRLAIWDSDTVFITMTVHPLGKDSVSRSLGPRLPAYCTGLGKAMLAHMPQSAIDAYLAKTELQPYTKYTIIDKTRFKEDLALSRSRGYAVSHRETLLHQIGVAAPIYNGDGNVIAAASVQLHPEETDDALIENRASRLLRATYTISVDLGYQPLSRVPIQD
jgi:DNA-binding IclR family transcriptional regulator